MKVFGKSQSFLLRRKSLGHPSPVFNCRRKYCSIRAATLDALDRQTPSVEISLPGTKLHKNQGLNPVVDSEIPQVVSLASDAHLSHKDFGEIELPELPPVSDPAFEFLLGVKLEMMSQVLDFGDSGVQASTRHRKTEMLSELQTFLLNKNNFSKLNSKYQRAIFIMLEKNVLPHCPVFPDRMRTLDYQVPVVNPSWPHVQLCHRLLLTFIQLFPDAEFVNMSVIRRVIWLFQLPDPNERECLMRFAAKFYELRPNSRNEIVNMLHYQLTEAQEGLALPYCINAILDVLCFVWATDANQHLHVHKIVERTGFPLIGSNYFHMFSDGLCALVRKVIELEPSFVDVVLEKLETHWPQSSRNQVAAVYFLMDIVIELPPMQLFGLGNNIFIFLGELTGGPSTQVVEACLTIWVKPEYLKWAKNPRVSRELIQTMLPPMLRLKQNNWLRRSALEKLHLAEEAMMHANREMYSLVQHGHGLGGLGLRTSNSVRRRLLDLEDCAGAWLKIGERACANGAEIDLRTWSRDTVAFLKQTAREQAVTIKFTKSEEDEELLDFE